jgi:cell division transport system ATP-binding protein
VADASPQARQSDQAAAKPKNSGPAKDETQDVAASVPPATTRTNPIIHPDVDLDELGLADRLGLSHDADDEVGPTR